MLVEKYRPNKLENIVGNNDIIEQFKKYDKNNLPHMILSGPPGVGKTTSIICLSKKILKDDFKNCFLELNASNERGIDIVRSKIKTFCQKVSNNVKIIFLDESENLTTQAQQALRRMIELYSKNTRFIFACNSLNPINNAIKSRCKIIKYNKINNENVIFKITEICKKENIEYTVDGINLLVTLLNGDLRNIINNLQVIHSSYTKININNVKKIINIPSSYFINKLMTNIIAKDFNESKNIMEKLLKNGHDCFKIIKMMFNLIKESTYQHKIKYLTFIGDIEYHIVMRADPEIQMIYLICLMCDL